MSEYIWGAFVIIAIIAFSIAGASAVLSYKTTDRECEVNSDCGELKYCGSDFICHEYPTIQQTIIKNDWTTPAGILGLAIVFAALILRKRRN